MILPLITFLNIYLSMWRLLELGNKLQIINLFLSCCPEAVAHSHHIVSTQKLTLDHITCTMVSHDDTSETGF